MPFRQQDAYKGDLFSVACTINTRGFDLRYAHPRRDTRDGGFIAPHLSAYGKPDAVTEVTGSGFVSSAPCSRLR